MGKKSFRNELIVLFTVGILFEFIGVALQNSAQYFGGMFIGAGIMLYRFRRAICFYLDQRSARIIELEAKVHTLDIENFQLKDEIYILKKKYEQHG